MSRATQIVYDVSGDASGIPSDQTGSFDGASARAPFAPGSSITLEWDANGDGVPGDVTVVTSRLITHSVYDTSDGPIEKDSVGVIQGGLASLNPAPAPYAGPYLHWTTDATYSVSGTYSSYGEQAPLVPSTTPISLLDWADVTPFVQNLLTTQWFAPCIAECTGGYAIGVPHSDLDATFFGLDGGSESFRFHLRPVPELDASLLGSAGLAVLALLRMRRS
ncbi:MAG: hypothetical protein ACHQ6T_05880 [Myxococcota bacterium]